MIERNHGLGVSRQAKAPGISRGRVRTLPRPARDADPALLRRIDELHLEHPFAGSRMLKGLLKAEGHEVDRLHVLTLMEKMAIAAPCRPAEHVEACAGSQGLPVPVAQAGGDAAEPGPGDGHSLHSDGARAIVARTNGAARLAACRAAVVDGFSRKVLSWRLSITLSADFCIEALEDALARHGQPGIVNTDSQEMVASSRAVCLKH